MHMLFSGRCPHFYEASKSFDYSWGTFPALTCWFGSRSQKQWKVKVNRDLLLTKVHTFSGRVPHRACGPCRPWRLSSIQLLVSKRANVTREMLRMAAQALPQQQCLEPRMLAALAGGFLSRKCHLRIFEFIHLYYLIIYQMYVWHVCMSKFVSKVCPSSVFLFWKWMKLLWFEQRKHHQKPKACVVRLDVIFWGILFVRGVRLSPLFACRKPPRMCYACWWVTLPVWWTWFPVMKRRVLVALGSGAMILLCLKKRGSKKQESARKTISIYCWWKKSG